MYGHVRGDWYGYDYGHQGVQIVSMILMWIVIAGLAYLLIRAWRATTDPTVKGPENRALGILDERFASGDLPEDEYLNRRRVLLDALKGESGSGA
jgi:uncharacterized membrane protein